MASEGWENNPDLKKLYVAKLKLETKKEIVEEYFRQYGVVADTKIINDQDGNSRGFAFVTMSDQAVVDKILDSRPHTIEGQPVFLRRAIPKDDPNPLAQAKTKKLFIGGLTDEATEDDIKNVLAIFTQHPPEQIKLMRDKNTNKFKGYAFAIFHSEDIVDKLFIIRNATIKNKKVEMKKAEEIGGPGGRGAGAGGRGRGFRGGRGGGQPRSGGGAGGSSGYAQSAYPGYSGYGDSGYGADDYSYGGYQYGNGYNYDAYSGGYAYGGGYSNSYTNEYGSEPSSYGPNRRGGGGRGRGGGGGGGYRPY